MGMNEVGHMSDQRKECQECGWRGTAAEVDKNDDPSGDQTHIFCPDCGGANIKDLDPEPKE